jgi:AcrR family transcriptional regulator
VATVGAVPHSPPDPRAVAGSSLGSAPAGEPVAGEGITARDQRAHILGVALHLMAEHGVHAMSMRRLATACGINVATIYHYFPSKAELLREVVAHQRYEELLDQVPPVDAGLAPPERLAALLRWIWREMATQDDMWRLLLGESLRGDHDVIATAAGLTAHFEQALDRWLAELFPDAADGQPRLGRVLRGVIYGFFIESLPLPDDDRFRLLAGHAEETGRVVFPG